MRRLGVALALVALATSAEASSWKKVAESPTAGSLLADMDSVRRTGSTVSVWLKWPKYRSDHDARIASAATLTKFYCDAGEFEMFDMILRDKNETVLFQLMDNHGRNPVAAGTVYRGAYAAVCNVPPAR